jgi:tetratricopeptide (TPR) repeat protein
MNWQTYVTFYVAIIASGVGGIAQQLPDSTGRVDALATQVGLNQATNSAHNANRSQAEETYAPEPALTPIRTSLAQGNLVEAEAATKRYLQDHTSSAEAHFLLGFILFREISARWLESGKGQIETLLYSRSDANGSLAKLRDGKARESLAEFTAGAQFNAPNAFDLKIVALDYILLKDYIDADHWMTQSLQRNPRDAQAWYYLGRTKYSESQFPEAIQAYVECLKIEPHNIQAEFNVGLSYEALGQQDQAKQAFENAIKWEAESSAKDPEPYIELAHLYLNQNDPEKAVPPLLESISMFPDVSKAHEELGRAYALLHRLPEAQRELERAVALDPDAPSLHCLLGQIYRQEKMQAKATEELDRCSALQQTEPAKSTGADQTPN